MSTPSWWRMFVSCRRQLIGLEGAPCICFLLNFFIQALGFAFGFEVGMADQSPALSLARPPIGLPLPSPLFLIIVIFNWSHPCGRIGLSVE